MSDILTPPGTVAPMTYYEIWRWDLDDKQWYKVVTLNTNGDGQLPTGQDAELELLDHARRYDRHPDEYVILEVTVTKRNWHE